MVFLENILQKSKKNKIVKNGLKITDECWKNIQTLIESDKNGIRDLKDIKRYINLSGKNTTQETKQIIQERKNKNGEDGWMLDDSLIEKFTADENSNGQKLKIDLRLSVFYPDQNDAPRYYTTDKPTSGKSSI